MGSNILSVTRRLMHVIIRKLQNERFFPIYFRSGTSKYPNPLDVFNAVIDDFTSQKRLGDKADFKSKEGNKKNECKISWYDDKWFSLSWNATDIKVTIRFPYKDSPELIFKEKNIEIPPTWKLERFKKGKRAEFRVNKEHANTIGLFLDLVFRHLYDCPENYNVVGHIPRYEGHDI